MSLSGQLLRGLKWHNFRNLDGVYHKDILGDVHKTEELNFYLNFVKVRDAKAVHKILERVMIADLSNKPALVTHEGKNLNDPNLLLKIEVKEEPVKFDPIKTLAEEAKKVKSKKGVKK